MNTRHPWQIDATDIEALAEIPTDLAALAERGSVAQNEHARAEEPLFLREARERADREGRAVEDVLAADVLGALNNEYPGEECLSPEQVADCVAGEANDEERRHLEQCADCRMIVELGRPREDSRRAFLAELTRTASVSEESSSLPKVSHRSSVLKLSAAPVALLSSALACSFLAGVVASWVYRSSSEDFKLRENVAVSPSGSDAVLAGNAGKYWLLDLEGERKPIEFKANEDAGLRLHTFTADGNYVTALGPKGKIAVWNLGELEAGATVEPQIYQSVKDWTAARNDKSADHSEP